MDNKFVFRQGKVDDVKCVLSMIKDLAASEDMSDGPKLTEEDLIRDSGMQGSNPICHLYVMEDPSEKNTLAGYSICFFAYSTWEGKIYYLEDFFLRPEYRNKGLGARMFREIAAKANEFGCKRLEFRVLNTNPAQRLYSRMGAVDITQTEKWHVWRVYHEQIVKLAEESKSQCK